MQSEKRDAKKRQNQSSQRFQYEVCQVESAGCIKKYGMYVSEPWKYAGTHILLHCGMILHYYATFPSLNLALGIINIVLHILCTLDLIKLAFTDPGMIPKIFPSYQKLAYRKIPTNYFRYASLLKYYQKQYRTVIKGHNLQLKFCNTCYIYRPPRTVHCQDCGICVQKFDHHCPWIGTCVAKKNYKYFLFFLTVLSILTVKIFIESIVVSAQTARWDGAEIIAKSVINIFLCIYIFPAMGFAVFMLALHLKFAATNVTTNQFCKETWQTLEGNPFKKVSWLKNIFKTISLHYQGKVKFEQRVYDRNDRILMENDSLSSLNDTKQVNKTHDHINNVNQFKSQNHKNYSTNDRNDGLEQDHYHEAQNVEQKQIDQNEQRMQSFKDPISIFDIGIKLHSGPITDHQIKLNAKGNQDSQSSSSQKASTSVLSQKDRSQQGADEISRQQEQKLKVIIEENQTDQHNQQHVDFKNNQSTFNQIVSPNKVKKQVSIIKMDSENQSQLGSKSLGFSEKKKPNYQNNFDQDISQNQNEQKPGQISKFSTNENKKSQLFKLKNQQNRKT